MIFAKLHKCDIENITKDLQHINCSLILICTELGTLKFCFFATSGNNLDAKALVMQGIFSCFLIVKLNKSDGLLWNF